MASPKRSRVSSIVNPFEAARAEREQAREHLIQAFAGLARAHQALAHALVCEGVRP